MPGEGRHVRECGTEAHVSNGVHCSADSRGFFAPFALLVRNCPVSRIASPESVGVLKVEGEEEYIDLSDYDTISYRVYGDGRKYIANFRTENWIVGTRNHDVWQAFLFAR